MKEPKFQCDVTIEISGEPDSLFLAVEPENKTVPKNMQIVAKQTETGIVCEIKGEMGIGTLKNTIDDILKAAQINQKIVDVIKDIKETTDK